MYLKKASNLPIVRFLCVCVECVVTINLKLTKNNRSVVSQNKVITLELLTMSVYVVVPC